MKYDMPLRESERKGFLTENEINLRFPCRLLHFLFYFYFKGIWIGFLTLFHILFLFLPYSLLYISFLFSSIIFLL